MYATKHSIEDACKEVKEFCLVTKDGSLQLSKSHAYLYQVQIQMHITGLQWQSLLLQSGGHDLSV